MTARPLLDDTAPEQHLVQLYADDDSALLANVARYVAEGLKRNNGVLLLMPLERWERLRPILDTAGASHERALEEGRLRVLDARAVSAEVIVDGEASRLRFLESVGVAASSLLVHRGLSGLRAYGELVGLLWSEGRTEAAARIEKYWNELLRADGFSLYCAYPVDVFGKDFAGSGMNEVLCAHTHLIPTAPGIEHAVERAIGEVLGAEADTIRPLMRGGHRSTRAAMPRGEGMILWVRTNLPDHAEEILTRARLHVHATDSRAPGMCA